MVILVPIKENAIGIPSKYANYLKVTEISDKDGHAITIFLERRVEWYRSSDFDIRVFLEVFHVDFFMDSIVDIPTGLVAALVLSIGPDILFYRNIVSYIVDLQRVLDNSGSSLFNLFSFIDMDNEKIDQGNSYFWDLWIDELAGNRNEHDKLINACIKDDGFIDELFHGENIEIDTFWLLHDYMISQSKIDC